ncbi:hypothetical protein D3C79_612250 [compost metagenome]
MIAGQAVLQGAEQRLHQSVPRRQLAQWLTADPVDFIHQIGVGEAGQDLLDVGGMQARVEAVAFHQHGPALLHGAAHLAADQRILDRLAHRAIAPQLAEVGGDDVAGVEGEQLALDEGHQVVGGLHARHLGQLALELGLVDDPLAEALHRHLQRIIVGRGRGNDAIHRRVDEADAVVEGGMIRDRQVLEYLLLEVAGAAYHVLAGDDVEGGQVAGIETGLQPLGQGAGNLVQDVGPDRSGDQIGGDDAGDHLVSGGADRRHVAHHVQLLIRPHHVHLVLLAVVELIDQGLVDVGEGDLMAGVRQQFSDEATTDIAGTKMQCFHDINLYNQRR